MCKSIDETSRLKFEKNRCMIRYIFKNTLITVKIYLNQHITPQPSDIKRILNEFYTNPICGYHRTYSRLKDQYIWSHMKRY